MVDIWFVTKYHYLVFGWEPNYSVNQIIWSGHYSVKLVFGWSGFNLGLNAVHPSWISRLVIRHCSWTYHEPISGNKDSSPGYQATDRQKLSQFSALDSTNSYYRPAVVGPTVQLPTRVDWTQKWAFIINLIKNREFWVKYPYKFVYIHRLTGIDSLNHSSWGCNVSYCSIFHL